MDLMPPDGSEDRQSLATSQTTLKFTLETTHQHMRPHTSFMPVTFFDSSLTVLVFFHRGRFILKPLHAWCLLKWFVALAQLFGSGERGGRAHREEGRGWGWGRGDRGGGGEGGAVSGWPETCARIQQTTNPPPNSLWQILILSTCCWEKNVQNLPNSVQKKFMPDYGRKLWLCLMQLQKTGFQNRISEEDSIGFNS